MTDYEIVLKNTFGFDKFRDKQLDIIKAIIEDKKDICVIMFTGYGKSLCYQFPPIYTNKITLVISPLISLMNDQCIKLKEKNISSICLNSTLSNKIKAKKEILENKYRIVYTTPEYIITQQKFIDRLYLTDKLINVAIDEAHCISFYGNDFRESYRKIKCLKEWLPDIPLMALTATATPRVEKDIIKTLGLVNFLVIKSSFDRPNLNIIVRHKSSLNNDILPLINNNSTSIIYCQTKKETEFIAELLKNNKIKCDAYHAGLLPLDRELVHDGFIDGSIKCVVATIAFGMGIDNIVRTVIHYGLPKDLESYYQEIGRAGRDGIKSSCYLFFSTKDMSTVNYFINQINNPIYKKHFIQLTNYMKNYVYLDTCRRKYILSYFGEEYEKDNCENCDNCCNNNNFQKFDFTKHAELFINTIIKTHNTYGMSTIINILVGSKSKKIINKFNHLKEYSKGNDKSVEWWKYLCRLLINNKYVREISISRNYGFKLKVSVLGLKWLKKQDHKLIEKLPNKFIEVKKQEKIKSNNKKTKTVLVTYDMFQNKKLSIKDISKEREIKMQTIEGHLISCYKQGLKLDLKRLGMDNKYNLISNKIKELNYPKLLRDIKHALPNNISYLQIILTLEMMKENKYYQDKMNEYTKVLDDFNKSSNKITKDYNYIKML